jgi:hypothetical protein
LSTPAPKSSAQTAIEAALIAPAEVPHRIGNGFRLGSGSNSRIAFSTPTW